MNKASGCKNVIRICTRTRMKWAFRFGKGARVLSVGSVSFKKAVAFRIDFFERDSGTRFAFCFSGLSYPILRLWALVQVQCLCHRRRRRWVRLQYQGQITSQLNRQQIKYQNQMNSNQSRPLKTITNYPLADHELKKH